jgi:hypothetical protein
MNIYIESTYPSHRPSGILRTVLVNSIIPA